MSITKVSLVIVACYCVLRNLAIDLNSMPLDDEWDVDTTGIEYYSKRHRIAPTRTY